MPFDLRAPLGLLFLIYGVLLACYGFLHPTALPAHSLSLNVDLVWGLVLLVVGGVLSVAARRSKKRT